MSAILLFDEILQRCLSPVTLFPVFEFVAVFLKFIFNTANEFTGLLFDAVAFSLVLIVGVQQIRKTSKRLSHLICKRNWAEGSLSQAWLGFLMEKVTESR